MNSTLKLGAAVFAGALFVSPVFAAGAKAPTVASGNTIMKVQPAPSAAKVQPVNPGTINKVNPPAGATGKPTTSNGVGFDHIIAPTTSTSTPIRSGGITRDPPPPGGRGGHKAHPDN